jgi:hypothetical protein
VFIEVLANFCSAGWLGKLEVNSPVIAKVFSPKWTFVNQKSANSTLINKLPFEHSTFKGVAKIGFPTIGN